MLLADVSAVRIVPAVSQLLYVFDLFAFVYITAHQQFWFFIHKICTVSFTVLHYIAVSSFFDGIYCLAFFLRCARASVTRLMRFGVTAAVLMQRWTQTSWWLNNNLVQLHLSCSVFVSSVLRDWAAAFKISRDIIRSKRELYRQSLDSCSSSSFPNFSLPWLFFIPHEFCFNFTSISWRCWKTKRRVKNNQRCWQLTTRESAFIFTRWQL